MLKNIDPGWRAVTPSPCHTAAGQSNMFPALGPMGLLAGGGPDFSGISFGLVSFRPRRLHEASPVAAVGHGNPNVCCPIAAVFEGHPCSTCVPLRTSRSTETLHAHAPQTSYYWFPLEVWPANNAVCVTRPTA